MASAGGQSAGPSVLGRNCFLLFERLGRWVELLKPHPDDNFYQFITTGIRDGFHIGFNHQLALKPAKHNLLSCRDHPEVVDNYILAEMGKGHLIGPLAKSEFSYVHCSPFGVIPKKGANA